MNKYIFVGSFTVQDIISTHPPGLERDGCFSIKITAPTAADAVVMFRESSHYHDGIHLRGAKTSIETITVETNQ